MGAAYAASVILFVLAMLVEPRLSPVWAWTVRGETAPALALVGRALILGSTAAKVGLDWRRGAGPTALEPPAPAAPP